MMNSLQKLWHKLTAPRATDEDAARREYMTKVILVIMSAVLLVTTPLMIVAHMYNMVIADVPSTAVLLSALLCGSWWLAQRGYWRQSAYIPPVLFLASALHGSYVYGMGTTTLMKYTITLIMTALLLDSRMQWVTLGLCIAGTFVLGAPYVYRHPDDTPLQDMIYWALTLGTFYVLVSLMLRFFTRQFQDSLERSRAFAEKLTDEIAERKKMEQQLVHAEKMSAIGKLASSIIHEVNNPLHSLLSLLELAQEDADNPENIREYLKIAYREALRVTHTANRVRGFSRLDLDEEKEVANVNDLVQQVLELTAKQCQHNEVEVIAEFAEDIPDLRIASGQIKQVFLNLVINALDAMPEGGQLHVSTARRAHEVCIRFTDTGTGISPQLLPRIFDEFYTTKDSGTGLGLYISRNIIEQHGGRIEVETQQEEGTTFAVSLPEL